MKEQIQYSDFEKINACCGKISAVEDFPEAKKPAYKLTIDFGPEVGIKKSSVQITQNYSKEELDCVLISPTKEARIGAQIY